MSNRSGHYSEHTLHHHQHDHARAALRRPAASQASVSSPSQAAEAGYTLVHAGKQVRFGPVVFWIVVGTVTMLGMWSAATATYFAFRDDVLTRLIAPPAVNCSISSNSTRNSIRSCGARPRWNRAPLHLAPFRTPRLPDRSVRHREALRPPTPRLLRGSQSPRRSTIP